MPATSEENKGFKQSTTSEAEIKEVDIAIVGGGIAGLYTALRLVKSEGYKNASFALFEATSRFGGRINTLEFPGQVLPFIADAGAMRYLPSQEIINKLIQYLGLGEKEKVYRFDFDTDAYLVRGRHISPKNKKRGQELEEWFPYVTNKSPRAKKQTAYRQLRRDERGLEPGELMALAIAKALAKIKMTDVDEDEQIHGLLSQTGGLRTLEEKIRRLGSQDKLHTLDISFYDLTLIEWMLFKHCARYDDLPLHTLSFWDLIQSQLSSEAYAFVEDGLGYQTIIGTWNAADAIPWFLADFGKVVDDSDSKAGGYRSLRGGMSQLTDALKAAVVAAFESSEGREVRRELLTNHTLEALTIESTSKVLLEFREEYSYLDYSSVLTFQPVHVGPFPHRYRAKKVVLAMSPGAILQVKRFGVPPESEKEFMRLAGAVTAHPLLKMFIFYKTPWWWAAAPPEQQAGATGVDADKNEFKAHRTFTSWPLRMLYSHGPISDSASPSIEGRGASSARMSMVMAYCDARHANYWDTLRVAPGVPYKSAEVASQIAQMSTSDRNIAHQLFEAYGVSEMFAMRAHDQMWRAYRYRVDHRRLNTIKQPTEQGLVAGRESVPKSEAVLYMDWGAPPFHGGWHSWNVGTKSSDVKTRIAKPFGGYDVFVCGEAFSSDQGWIEGALRSAERMVYDHFGKEQPLWLLGRTANRERFDDYIHW
jgi:Flavin containing amine oxidoreductase